MSPVSFRDAYKFEKYGIAGFIRMIPSRRDAVLFGALFSINVIGEPFEFTYHNLEIPNRFLWKADALKKYAAREMLSALFQTCRRSPVLLLYLRNEIPDPVFAKEILTEIPVCAIEPVQADWAEKIDSSPELERLFQHTWNPAAPEPGSQPEILFEKLRKNGLILEPFFRCLQGLQEVYRERFPTGK